MTSTPARHPRALVLDADSARRGELERALEALRFAILSAADGTSGLGLLLDELLDLDALVIAADLPHRDARSFAQLIRQAGGERDLAIVVLLEEASPQLRGELLALGVDAVLEPDAGPEAAAKAVCEAVRARAPESDAARQPVRVAPAAALVPVERWALASCRPLLPA